MPTPSLILVPARFKTGKLYTPLATTSGGVVLGASGDFNVTRATTATRVNASGLIEVVASGIPRLDYPLGGGCPALLVEPAGTNLIVQSQNWLASGWRSDATGNVTTVTGTSGTLDPLGTNTANAISPTSGNTSHLKVGNDNSASFTSGTIYTESGFFKQGTGDAGRYVQMTYPAARFSQNGFANFDLQAGAVVASGGTADTNRAARIENYGNGWYRCSFTATCTSTGTENGFTAVLITASGSTRAPSFAGTTTDVLYGWGAQTETGSVATSYIPTTTTSATRNADVISLSGAVSGCIGQTEGTIYLDATYDAAASTATVWFSVLGTSNSIGLALGSLIRSIVNGQSDNLAGSPPDTSGIRIAWAYNASGVVCFINGTQYTLTNGGSQVITQLNRVLIDMSSHANRLYDTRIRSLALYTTRLTNSELQALTT